MKLTIGNVILIGSILLFVSLVASRTTKFGIPTLLLFLLVGMLAGSNGPGGINFYDPKAAKFIGSIALSFILFSGGLETKWNDIRPVFWQGVSLSTLGVIITAATIGIADGSTRLAKGDKLYVMADDQKSMEKLYNCLGKP